jgi:hypothetical protein
VKCALNQDGKEGTEMARKMSFYKIPSPEKGKSWVKPTHPLPWEVEENEKEEKENDWEDENDRIV